MGSTPQANGGGSGGLQLKLDEDIVYSIWKHIAVQERTGRCVAALVECKRTTAGYKDSFAYQRLIELLAEAIINPDEAMILGGTWEIPVNEGLQPKNFIQNLKLQGEPSVRAFKTFTSCHWGTIIILC